jgi:catechol 2,3-dioxygenase-like lactoylglutathione lyase family enzyme
MKCILLLAAILLTGLPGLTDKSVLRPKIYGIAFVRLKATDFEKSRAFYENILGLRGGFDDCKDMPGLCYLVNPWQHVELVQSGSRERNSFLTEIGLTTPDVPQMHEYLLSHGQSPGPIFRGPNGLRLFEITDPEGNRLAFVESSGADSQVDGPRQPSSRLFHAGFVVKNITDENRFYVDLLGFRLYWRGGFKNDGTDWYELQVPEGDNWIEYMLNISPNADQQDLGVQNHFSLGVSDIKAACKKLTSNGLKTDDQPEIGRDGKWSFDIYDPDLTRIEFMEFKPAQEPCCHPYTADHPTP